MQIERGGSPRPIDDFITDAPNGLNWVKIGDAPTQGNYITKTAEKIRPEGLSKTREVHPGDLILSNSMSFGKPYIMGIDGCIHDGWLLIRNTYGVFDLTFLCHLLGTPQMLGQYRSLAAGSTVNNLNKELVGNTVVTIPSITEQRVLGDYLEQLDHLITLHQRKYAFLFRRFRAAISKKLATSTFSWEQRKFSDITFPAGEKNRDNLPLESYSITNEHGFVPQDEKFENGGTMREADKRMYYIVSPNSFAYNPARINVGSIGYQNIGKNVIVSSLYEVFKTSEDVDDRLLWHWFKSPDFQKLIMQLQEGGVRLYFYYDKLCMGEVSLPSLEEQRKIGKLFDTLDNLITLHQRERISFSGRASRLIPPINKKRITSSWEQRKAKELFISTADKGYPDLPVLSATQDRGMIRRDENSINIFHDKKNEAGYKRVLPGQFVIHLRSFQGGFAHSAIEGITSPAYTVFGFSEPEKHDSEYWKYVFTSKAFIRRLETVTYGIRDGRSISYDEFLTLSFAYPSKAEQTAIARYLDKLSDLITLHQRKGKAAVTGCSNDANNSKGVYCKARDFGYKCYKKVKSQQIRCLIAVFIFFV